MKRLGYGLVAAVLTAQVALATDIRITEWMYQGVGGLGEFVEFTNISGAPIDMTGWSFDDNSQTPFSVDLSGFGIVQPGESVILTEDDAEFFRTKWALPLTTKIVGNLGGGSNLGRNDEINLFDALGNLRDRLTYGDQDFPGTIRTQFFSGNPATPAALGANDVYQWVLSAVGDQFGSYTASSGDVGNPGIYIPEPASLALVAVGLLATLRRRS